MKRIFQLLVVLSLAHQGRTQFVEIADQRTPFTEYGRLFPVGENWAFAYRYAGFSLRAATGEQLEMIPTPMSVYEPGTSDWGGDVMTLPDGGAILVGPLFGCDFIGGTFLWRLNADAELIWETELMSDSYGFTLLAGSPFEQIAAVGFHEVVITDMAGTAQTIWSIPNDSIRVALWGSPGSLLFGAGNSVMRYSAGGEALDSVQMGEPVRDLRLSDTGVLALTSDSLYVLDDDMNITLTHGMPVGAFSARGFIQGSTDVLVRCDSAFVAWNASQGTSIHQIPELLSGQRIQDVFWTNGSFITSSTVMQNDRLSGLMRTYGSDGSTSWHDEDVSIALTVDSAWFEPLQGGGGAPTNLYYRRANVSVSVTVVGPSTIHDLVISHESSPYYSYSCEPETTTIRLTDAQLEAGTDTTVTMEGLYLWWGVSAPGGSGTSEVCVVAQSPNYKVDRNPEDNISCQEITIVNTVGIDDHDPFMQPRAFPNPFQDHIVLRTAVTGPLNITLLDATGRKVFTSRIAASSGPTRIDLPDLRDGIYFLRSLDGTHQWTERLVRQEH